MLASSPLEKHPLDGLALTYHEHIFSILGRCIVEAIWIYDNSKKTALRDTFYLYLYTFCISSFLLSVGFIIISADGQLLISKSFGIFGFCIHNKTLLDLLSFKSSMAPRDSHPGLTYPLFFLVIGLVFFIVVETILRVEVARLVARAFLG